jgi:hypothetical protein
VRLALQMAQVTIHLLQTSEKDDERWEYVDEVPKDVLEVLIEALSDSLPRLQQKNTDRKDSHQLFEHDRDDPVIADMPVDPVVHEAARVAGGGDEERQRRQEVADDVLVLHKGPFEHDDSLHDLEIKQHQVLSVGQSFKEVV